MANIKNLNIFNYKGNTYTRIIPSPHMYRSQLIRDVTNRGDIFVLNIATGVFTVIPGSGKIEALAVTVRKKAKAVPTTQLKLAL